MENDNRGLGRPDNKEVINQRDARPKSPIDLVEYRRRKEEQEEDFLSPEDKQVLNDLREWMHSIPLPDIEEHIERTVALIYETPLNFDEEQDLLANTEQKKAKVLYLHKPSSQDTEPPPSPNTE